MKTGKLLRADIEAQCPYCNSVTPVEAEEVVISLCECAHCDRTFYLAESPIDYISTTDLPPGVNAADLSIIIGDGLYAHEARNVISVDRKNKEYTAILSDEFSRRGCRAVAWSSITMNPNHLKVIDTRTNVILMEW